MVIDTCNSLEIDMKARKEAYMRKMVWNDAGIIRTAWFDRNGPE